MSGYVGDLSPQQESALEKLKQCTTDVTMSYFDDYFYLRFLRARDFDVLKAETMMRKNLKFRTRIGADTLIADYKPHPILDKHYPIGYLGPDKEGNPVRYSPFKNLDLKGFVYTSQKSDILKYLAHMFEEDILEMKTLSKKFGKVIEKHSYIIDLEGYTFRQASNRDSLNLLGDILKLYEAHYPERMKAGYFINIPTYFFIILNIVKPFISENTLKKFRFYGKDYQKYLLEDIDADVLPKCLGGTRTDPDGNPRCETIINYGALIPEECYVLKATVQSLEKQEGVTEIKVPKKAFRTVEFNVPEPNSRVEWTFETQTNDIGIGLYLKKKEGSSELEEILPPERVSCHLVPETGTYMCEKAGDYSLMFDNTYSWFSSKRVFYKIKVTTASELDAESIDC